MKYIFFSKLVLLLFQSRRYFILPAASLRRDKQGRSIQANTRNDNSTRLAYTIISSILWDLPAMDMVSVMPSARQKYSISCIP